MTHALGALLGSSRVIDLAGLEKVGSPPRRSSVLPSQLLFSPSP